MNPIPPPLPLPRKPSTLIKLDTILWAFVVIFIAMLLTYRGINIEITIRGSSNQDEKINVHLGGGIGQHSGY